jgi:hypothetical protein
MIELVSNCELEKSKYCREVGTLWREARVEEPGETEVLHTQAEVDRFKTNLKKSVILSFAASNKQSDSASSQKIASNIDTRPKSTRIDIERNAYLNRDARGNDLYFPKAMSVASKGSFRRSIISLIDDTISSVMGTEREITRQSARDLEIFLKLSMMLERHLGDVGCILGRIKRLFIVYIEKTFRDTAAASLRMGDFTDNVKQFLVILREAVVDYYSLGEWAEAEHPNLFIANDENILSACTAILFKDPTFYAQTFAIVSHYCRAREESFAQVLLHLKGSTPERFLVKDKFCLNSKTIETYINSLQSAAENSMIESIELELNGDKEEPYKTCIEQLRELGKTKSPISKMKAIVTCSEGITNEIERFYERNGLRKEKWMLDADQVLSIFCYILVHAKVEHLLSHLFILENFATNHQMISMSGYYLSVINCAIEQLENDYEQLIQSSSL